MTFDDGAGHAFVFSDPEATNSDPRRLEQLRSTGLLAARHVPGLGVVTHLAVQMTEASSALVTLVDADRQVIPSVHGADGQRGEPFETPMSQSMCQYVVMNDAALIVGDARTHPVLRLHPAVLDGSLVAYAGFPIHAPDGSVLGALCAVDVVPRTWTPAHVSGLKNLAIMVDTTIALQLSQREVTLEHTRLLHILDGAAHALIVIADGYGVIRTMNHNAEVALGIVVHDGAATNLSDLLESGQPWRPEDGLDGAQDWTLVHNDEKRIFSVRVSTLRDPQGEIDGYIVVGDDVSARRKAEDLLHDTVRKQAEAVDRLEALDAQRGAFIATASHELRTPVTSMLGYTELLADGECGELTTQQQALVGRLVRNGRRLNHLIEDLLNWDQIGSDRYEQAQEQVDVRELSEQAWGSLSAYLAGRDLQTRMTIGPDIPHVSGDLAQLERALFNLLSNAVKFTPDGGTIGLSVWADSQLVHFEVSDTGCGISEDDQLAVFEPFFRTSDAQANAIQGSGIGLSVVRRIIDAHGGTIELTSVVGHGTSVHVTIPVRQQDQAADPVEVA